MRKLIIALDKLEKALSSFQKNTQPETRFHSPHQIEIGKRPLQVVREAYEEYVDHMTASKDAQTIVKLIDEICVLLDEISLSNSYYENQVWKFVMIEPKRTEEEKADIVACNGAGLISPNCISRAYFDISNRGCLARLYQATKTYKALELNSYLTGKDLSIEEILDMADAKAEIH